MHWSFQHILQTWQEVSLHDTVMLYTLDTQNLLPTGSTNNKNHYVHFHVSSIVSYCMTSVTINYWALYFRVSDYYDSSLSNLFQKNTVDIVLVTVKPMANAYPDCNESYPLVSDPRCLKIKQYSARLCVPQNSSTEQPPDAECLERRLFKSFISYKDIGALSKACIKGSFSPQKPYC